MTKKTGRNEPCPCGSGMKYKKCCLGVSNDDISDFRQMDFPDFYKEMKKKAIESEKVDAISFFSEYDNSELLKLFSLLHVVPNNHGKNIRLEELTKQAIKSNGSGGVLNIEKIKKYIHENFSHNHNEDPPENLFTENIMTPAGNMTVFSGITEGQVYILQQFLNTISRNNTNINSEFKKEALESTMLLLAISDFIANGMGYSRNIKTEISENNDIYFPESDFIKTKAEYFAITENELITIAKSVDANLESINDYLLDSNDEGFMVDIPDANPIIYKPIFKTDTEYIIVSPTTIVFACVNNILRKAKSYDCIVPFIEFYSQICWNHCEYMLDDMGYHKLSFDFTESSLPIHEGIFLFDTNKIAYVLFKYDDGLDYDPEMPLMPHSDLMRQPDKYQERRKEVYEQILLDERFEDHKFFHINIISGIGRPHGGTFDPAGLKWEAIGFSLVDLLILYKSGRCHNLTFWNYSLALNDRALMTPFFLDNITYFLDNEESLYPSDDKVDFLSIAVGNALEFKSKAIINHDEFLAVFPTKNGMELLPVTREKLPAQLPIYSTRRIPFLPFRVITPVLGKDFWIIPKQEFKKIDNEVTKFTSEICIAVAYWIAELSTSLKNKLDLKATKPIVIEIGSVDVFNSNFDFENLDKARALEKEIIIEINDNIISVELNEYFYYFLYRSDNVGERILIQEILKGIHLLLSSKGLYSSLSEPNIESLLNQNMPIGLKKKLLIQVSDFDIRISPRNVKSIRELHPYAINRQIDNLAVLLNPEPYKPKRNINKKDKKKLINSAVIHFYKGLRELIDVYDFDDMLSKLLILYEASIQRREHYYFETTPKIECFKGYTDIYEHISKENKKNIQYSLSLRCLIEHVIAEPPKGDKRFDVSGIDSTLAYMHNIINWGFISDEINFNITDIEVSLLPSGRIGTDKTFQNSVIEPFYKMKFDEDIHDLVGRFNKKFEQDVNNKLNDTEFDSAFEDEFSIKYEVFSDIIFESVFLAFEEDGSIYRIPKKEFLNIISIRTNINKVEIEKLLSNFSLFKRGRVENVSEFGYQNIDFYPWRYNRALSLLKKPFVITKTNEVEYIWFGARALLDFKFNIIGNIYSGRYPAKSGKLISFLAKGNNIKGKDFNDEIFEILNSNLKSHVYREVGIKPNSTLKHSADIGDLDILVIDESRKRIIAFECKNINIARTPYEMHQELMNFISGDKPWIPKVDKRNKWMKSNLASLKNLNGVIDYSDFEFEYMFLTNEAIPLPFIRENHISYRFITAYEIKKNADCIFSKPQSHAH